MGQISSEKSHPALPMGRKTSICVRPLSQTWGVEDCLEIVC